MGVAAMSYWCAVHPQYEGKQSYSPSCFRCRELYRYRNPEWRYDSKRLLEDMVDEFLDREARTMEKKP